MNRLPVPSLSSALVKVTDGRGNIIGKGYVIPPWNSWFQQFSQSAPSVATIAVGVSPFSYTANSNGNLIISGGTVSNISLIRGTTTIVIATSTAIPRIVPISIGDTVRVTYTVLPTLQFLGD